MHVHRETVYIGAVCVVMHGEEQCTVVLRHFLDITYTTKLKVKTIKSKYFLHKLNNTTKKI